MLCIVGLARPREGVLKDVSPAQPGDSILLTAQVETPATSGGLVPAVTSPGERGLRALERPAAWHGALLGPLGHHGLDCRRSPSLQDRPHPFMGQAPCEPSEIFAETLDAGPETPAGASWLHLVSGRAESQVSDRGPGCGASAEFHPTWPTWEPLGCRGRGEPGGRRTRKPPRQLGSLGRWGTSPKGPARYKVCVSTMVSPLGPQFPHKPGAPLQAVPALGATWHDQHGDPGAWCDSGAEEGCGGAACSRGNGAEGRPPSPGVASTPCCSRGGTMSPPQALGAAPAPTHQFPIWDSTAPAARPRPVCGPWVPLSSHHVSRLLQPEDGMQPADQTGQGSLAPGGDCWALRSGLDSPRH